MLESLRFVQGAVAKKDYVATLQHFRIEGGRVRGFNGRMALCAPIAVDLAVSPKAVPFVKAIAACQTKASLEMTKAGRLAVRSGKFKAFIECANEPYPGVDPEGQIIPLAEDGHELLPVLATLAPLMSEDASREWSQGILFDGKSVFATNNVILAERWLGVPFPHKMNIPKGAVQELLRIGEEPLTMQVAENSVTFHFEGDRWLRTQLSSTDWPDVRYILDKAHAGVSMTPAPAELFDALPQLTPFLDKVERVHFRDGGVGTSVEPGEGAHVAVTDIPDGPCFSHHMLGLLAGTATHTAFDTYPKPCPFSGEQLRGVIVGVRA